MLTICETQSRGSKELMAAWKDAQQGGRLRLAPVKIPETLWKKTAVMHSPSRRTISSPGSAPSAAVHRLQDFVPEEIARQIDLMEHRAFVAIDLREFFRQAHNKSNAKTRAANLVAFITRFERVRALAHAASFVSLV